MRLELASGEGCICAGMSAVAQLVGRVAALPPGPSPQRPVLCLTASSQMPSESSSAPMMLHIITAHTHYVSCITPQHENNSCCGSQLTA